MDEIATEFANWLKQHDATLAPLLITAALLVGASIFISLLKKRSKQWLRKLEARFRLPYETAQTISRALIGALWLIVMTLILEIWGVGLGGIWTVAVSVTTVIGVGFLATWTTMVSNVTATVFIAIWKPFHLGDTVKVIPENLKGRAIDSNLMFVTLREESGSLIQVPNNMCFRKLFRVRGGERPPFAALESKARFARQEQPF
jgi:small-conductance mechanosensitive channel